MSSPLQEYHHRAQMATAPLLHIKRILARLHITPFDIKRICEILEEIWVMLVPSKANNNSSINNGHIQRRLGQTGQLPVEPWSRWRQGGSVKGKNCLAVMAPPEK
ncbi:hypothetical protein AVEN_178539-1 [Araneus ventricosus]|uniref:Uncharacterized protein n=1 Tax=Araneus ventricosus TaxID=182803 RepID=A0A4Y2X265_ARAVE|nr:hypothetical protein AVEN_43967-1 [Araneus ventricosus]GBO43730.1 hypothetical protein AVEN_74013-1 [Araneus ventricosus]GBO43785.1 hypothetical protein AVEN_184952-1 [Araneus ventricosus]GBO43794.1 hypothetical protein AVEN_178539-1 [Araneus ventricosus]